MKKVILNRRKRTTNKPMKKNTHEITDIEGLINDKLYIMQNGNTLEEKKKARKEVIRFERHLRDVSNKQIEQKKYPERKVPKDISKKELLALIDSVQVPDDKNSWDSQYPGMKRLMIEKELDLSGGSPIPGENRFKFVEKGW